MKSKAHCFALMVIAILISGPRVPSQTINSEPRKVTLVARRINDAGDNYVDAAFSFEHGVNGRDALRVTGNDWDLLFGNSPDSDTFDVTMVVDDCSRIRDLGELNWEDGFEIPVLPAHPAPAREQSVRVVVGHMYVVHTKDRETDLYALFRVEALEPGKNTTISWKRIPSPAVK